MPTIRSLERRLAAVEARARRHLPADDEMGELWSWLTIEERLALERVLEAVVERPATALQHASAEAQVLAAQLAAAERRARGLPARWWLA
jgi:hypothetical protein